MKQPKTTVSVKVEIDKRLRDRLKAKADARGMKFSSFIIERLCIGDIQAKREV